MGDTWLLVHATPVGGEEAEAKGGGFGSEEPPTGEQSMKRSVVVAVCLSDVAGWKGPSARYAHAGCAVQGATGAAGLVLVHGGHESPMTGEGPVTSGRGRMMGDMWAFDPCSLEWHEVEL